MIWDFRFMIYDLGFGISDLNTECTEDTENFDLWLKISDLGFMMVECLQAIDLHWAPKKSSHIS
jgi:hypothetical protein